MHELYLSDEVWARRVLEAKKVKAAKASSATRDKKDKKGKKKDKARPGSAPRGVAVTHNPLGLKIKKKCCRKNPRCKNCPVVYARLARTGAWERNDSTLSKEWKQARRW